ncbi:hypothetical protein HYW75_03545 [Candidatus Pacearchaeota archaeon]|nr:hypothetical protein [Candidatus Pacearchaeota archaeon]
MKGVFIILDGAADEPCQSLGQKTPLQIAKTPNLDSIARKSNIDHCYTVQESYVPESDKAIVSLLGYNFISTSRGALEAKGLGFKLKNGDLAFRCNFATIDNIQDRNIIDRRAGRTLTTKEAKILAEAINNNVSLQFQFEFRAGIQHRGVLVIRGGFSSNITNVEINKEKLEFSQPQDEEDDSKLAAELVNSFVRQSYEILNKHPINIARAKKGLFSANVIMCRGPGNEPANFKKLKGKWIALGYTPLEIGIAEAARMDIFRFKYPKLKGIDVYENLYLGLKKAVKHAIKMLKRYRNKYEYFFIHFKELDVAGHDNKPLDKVKMIEILDEKFFSFLKNYIDNEKLIIIPDHMTSCRQKAHTSNPVPVLIYPSNKEQDNRFTEEQGLKGRKIMGRRLLVDYFFSKQVNALRAAPLRQSLHF